MNELYAQLAIAIKWLVVIFGIGFVTCGVGGFFIWLLLIFDYDKYVDKKKKKKSNLHPVTKG